MRRNLVIDALEMAWFRRHPDRNHKLIFHSDHGRQYASDDFNKVLIESMSGKGNCWDNICSETLFGSLKVERLHGQRFETIRQAKDETIAWLLRYNQTRMHSTLAMPARLNSKGNGRTLWSKLLPECADQPKQAWKCRSVERGEKNDEAVFPTPSYRPWKSILPISTFPRHDHDEDEYLLKPAGLRDTHSEGEVSWYVYALLLWFNFFGRFFAGRLFGRAAFRSHHKQFDLRTKNKRASRHLYRC
jgi:hypothetical protein